MSGLAEHYLDEGRRQMRGYKRKAGGGQTLVLLGGLQYYLYFPVYTFAIYLRVSMSDNHYEYFG
jgi:hypothetical protein